MKIFDGPGRAGPSTKSDGPGRAVKLGARAGPGRQARSTGRAGPQNNRPVAISIQNTTLHCEQYNRVWRFLASWKSYQEAVQIAILTANVDFR